MKKCMGRNAATTYGMMGRQKDTAVPQGKTNAGRTIAWKKPVAIHVSNQTTRESRELGDSQFHHSRSVKRTSRSPLEVVSAKKPKRTETDEDQWMRTVQKKSEARQIAREKSDSSRRTLSNHSRAVKRTSGSPMEVVSAKKPKRTETDEDQWMRTVQKKSEARQIAREKSDSSRRTLSNHSRAVKRTSGSPMEVVSAKKPKRTETDEDQWIEMFKKQVDSAIQKLHEERKHVQDDLLFCLKIVETTEFLIECLKDRYESSELMAVDHHNCEQYVMSKIAPLYNTALGPALEILQHRITTKDSWIYFYNLRMVTRYFRHFNPYNQDSQGQDYEKKLKSVWREHVYGEFSYLRFMKNIPDNKYSAESTLKNINWLLSNEDSPIISFKFMTTNEIKNLKTMATSMYHEAIDHNINNSNSERKKEDPSISIEVLPYNPMVRIHYDKILMQFEKVTMKFENSYHEEEEYQSVMEQCTDFLEQLSKLHDKHNKLIGSHYTILRNKLEREILRTIDRINAELKKHTDDDNPLKEKALKLITHLEEGGYLNKHRRNYYSGDLTLKGVERNHTGFSKMTVHQYHLYIEEIFSDIKKNVSLTIIVRKLRKIINHKSNWEKKDHRNLINSRVECALVHLYRRDFLPIFDTYDARNNNKKSTAEFVTIMRKYKDVFIKTIGNEFILKPSKLPLWRHLACLAWSDDIDELCKKSSFNEYDVDDLLHLKDIVPNPLQNNHLNSRIQRALKNILLFMPKNNPSVVLTKRVMKLSEWVEDLDKQNDLDPKLYSANKKWRKWQEWKKAQQASMAD